MVTQEENLFTRGFIRKQSMDLLYHMNSIWRKWNPNQGTSNTIISWEKKTKIDPLCYAITCVKRVIIGVIIKNCDVSCVESICWRTHMEQVQRRESSQNIQKKNTSRYNIREYCLKIYMFDLTKWLYFLTRKILCFFKLADYLVWGDSYCR